MGVSLGDPVRPSGFTSRPPGPPVPPPALTAAAQWSTLALGLRVPQESEHSFVPETQRTAPQGSVPAAQAPGRPHPAGPKAWSVVPAPCSAQGRLAGASSASRGDPGLQAVRVAEPRPGPGLCVLHQPVTASGQAPCSGQTPSRKCPLGGPRRKGPGPGGWGRGMAVTSPSKGHGGDP